MTKAHIYLFSDACPSDWLVSGNDNVWHTIVNLAFQSDPNLYPLIDKGCSHEEVLPKDEIYNRFIAAIQAKLRGNKLQKWKSGGDYKKRFCDAFAAVVPEFTPIISACSYQEKTLRDSKAALLNSYNNYIGGVEGRGIGFAETLDNQGRNQMTHSFMNFNGLQQIHAPENKMLVLLMMSWFVADQYVFFSIRLFVVGNTGSVI